MNRPFQGFPGYLAVSDSKTTNCCHLPNRSSAGHGFWFSEGNLEEFGSGKG
ncbi:hypothetical protein Hdeb2414_s0063g00764591 [Helianthus debilis subsp. tardiflorus]